MPTQPLMPPPLQGGFIQITEDVRRALLQGDALERFLDRLAGWRMDTLIVQRLAWLADGETHASFDLTTLPAEADPIPALLIGAASRGISAFLGLVEPAHNADTVHWTPQRLQGFLPLNQALARRAHLRYDGLDAWRGWYIPLENWVGKYPQGQQAGNSRTWPEAWCEFFTAVTTECRRLNGQTSRPVALSPCLPGPNYDLAAPIAVAAFAPTIAGSGIDILMLQDSVGAKPQCWTPELAGDHLECLQDLALATGSGSTPAFELWANLECFTTLPSGERLACSLERLKRQVANSQPAARRVGFDLFHHMNDRVRGGRTDAQWSAAQELARGYDDWLKAQAPGVQLSPGGEATPANPRIPH